MGKFRQRNIPVKRKLKHKQKTSPKITIKPPTKILILTGEHKNKYGIILRIVNINNNDAYFTKISNKECYVAYYKNEFNIINNQ